MSSFSSGLCPVRVVLLPDRPSRTGAEREEVCAKPLMSGPRQDLPETKRGARSTVTGPPRSVARCFMWVSDTAVETGPRSRGGRVAFPLRTGSCYVVPARKPPVLRQRQRCAAVRRCQPEIQLHMQVPGSNRPLTTHGRTNFKISGTESQLRKTERNNREDQLRVAVAAAPVAATR